MKKVYKYLFVLLATILSLTAFATQTGAAESSIPTTIYNGASVPDWTQASLSDLPAIQSPGSVEFPKEIVSQLGYDPSRSWESGSAVSDVLSLGDVQDAFGLEQLNLDRVAQMTGLDLNQISLINAPVIGQQTIASLTRAIPGLGDFQLGQVQPLANLVGQGQSLSSPISAIAAQPELGKLALNQIPLDQYSFTQIPGLTQVPLSSLQNWQSASINGIPGLSQVPMAQFPVSPGQFLGFVAIHDMTYGGDKAHKESRQTPTKYSITGSDKVGFKYECVQSKGCDYVELRSPLSLGLKGDPSLDNARWIRGGKGPGEQMVAGGKGVLGQLNGGKEPTGRHPFGPAFKVVLTQTDESEGSGQFSLYFRVCYKNGAVDLGCTPYFIGPVPFLPTKEKGLVFVGLSPMEPPNGIQQPEIPQEVQDLIDQYGGTSSDNSESSDNCQIDPSRLDGVSRAALSRLPADEMGRAAKYMPYIVQECGKAGVTDKNQLAYILATAEHESDHFRTTNEYSRTQYDSCGWGEGLIQVTWCENKRKVFQKLGLPAYGGPGDQRLHDPRIAAAALCRGMKEGWYTGRSINQCIGNGRANLGCARSVVNGDYSRVGSTIDQKYRSFEQGLQSASGGGMPGGVVCSNNKSLSTPGDGKSTGSFQRPAGGPVTSDFGPRQSPCAGCSSFHKGMDFGVPTGTSVKAADGGKVLYAGQMQGYGNVMIVEHSGGKQTLYAHLSSFTAQAGQPVSAGQVIAKSGSTGVGTGAHLHFEVIEGAQPGNYRSGHSVDPRKFLKL